MTRRFYRTQPCGDGLRTTIPRLSPCFMYLTLPTPPIPEYYLAKMYMPSAWFGQGNGVVGSVVFIPATNEWPTPQIARQGPPTISRMRSTWLAPIDGRKPFTRFDGKHSRLS